VVGEARDPDGDTGPLDGLTVLDASRVLVGPFCTMQLGDLGAEVIKIERPGEGRPDADVASARLRRGRRRPERLLRQRQPQQALRRAEPRGRGRASVFRDLAREADVVVENFRVGKMAEWDLDYPDLAAENPELICGISGYGEWGPDRDKPAAYDIMMQARGGFMSITGVDGGPRSGSASRSPTSAPGCTRRRRSSRPS